ncbi:hypothetical protein VPH35_023509 [Triticum aestivum]
MFQPNNMQMLLQLGLGFVLLAAQYAPGIAAPSSQCRRQCGNVEIPYPLVSIQAARSHKPSTSAVRSKMASQSHSVAPLRCSTFLWLKAQPGC